MYKGELWKYSPYLFLFFLRNKEVVTDNPQKSEWKTAITTIEHKRNKRKQICKKNISNTSEGD